MTGSAPPPAAESACVTIGGWRLYPALNRIERVGEAVHLEPKAAAVLRLLAERAGEAVARDELLQAVWPGTVVSDDALTQVVIKLRKALGDDSRAPRYIQTIPKRGYRLIATVSAAPQVSVPDTADRPSRPGLRRWLLAAALLLAGVLFGVWMLSGDAPSPPIASSTPAPAEPLSIAVLPFEAVGESAAQSRLAFGIGADLGTDLAKLSGFRVISASLRGINELPARYVVSGSVQRSESRVLIHTRLLETRTQQQLWSARYDRPLGDLFAVQQAISQQIVRQLAVQLSSAERQRLARRYTRSLGAYEDFLRGQGELMLRQRAANRRARASYLQAIEQDPAFARAYAGLALSHAADYRHRWVTDGDGALQRAADMANTARQIDPGIPQVYWVLAYVDAQHQRFDSALQQLTQALQLDHSYADAYALMGGINTYRGEPEKTLPLLREAMRLRPDAGYLYYLLLGRAYFFLGDQQQAGINLREALSRNPATLEARLYLAASAAASGDADGADWELGEIRTLNPDFELDGWLETYPLADAERRDHLRGVLQTIGL